MQFPYFHILDGSEPAWTVDWGYNTEPPMSGYSVRAWYLYFATKELAEQHINMYLKGQAYRLYPGSVQRIP